MKKNTFCMNLVRPFVVSFLILALVLGGTGTAICAHAAEKGPEELHNAYLYRLEDGQLKYWLDLSGDDLKLHCFFRSSDPFFYEKVYTLTPDEAASSRRTIIIRSVVDDMDMDISSRFLFMAVTFADDKATLSVVRDDKTLAGGTEDNLLTGSYEMTAGKPTGSSQAGGSAPVSGTYDDYRHYDGSAYQGTGGRLKYWIEFHDNFELHCFFSNDDPSTGASYEEVYTLYPDFDNSEAQTLWIRSVLNGSGNDISDSFQAFLFQFSSDDSVIMEVSRDESKLAGGGSNNLTDGSYMMKKGAALETVRRLLPEEGPAAGQEGSTGSGSSESGSGQAGSDQNGSGQAGDTASGNTYTPDQLCTMAQDYYNRHNGYYPPVAEYVDNNDGTYTLHLFEIVDDGNGYSHTATSAWYTVDAHGIGKDDIMGNEVDLSN